jgi:cellulose synthase/poly-beta-1,6-N-acetylglucosamine synthase-like glycosyltransferase
MPAPLAAAVLVAYGLVLAVLFVHGLSFLRLTWIAVRDRRRRPSASTADRWPSVTVQLPIFNERYVAERLIDAVARFEYPGALQIQVLDDSTDDTIAIAAAIVRRWRERGVDAVHLHRTERLGFKAGALAEGLAVARGERIAIFDADFIPRPDFLLRMVPILESDPGLAFVQARWDHANPDASLLTRLQALAIDGHFAVEQHGRWSGGDWFNFNGTAGVWRRAAIVDAGGWRSTTLTEDLDLSYRAFLRGWRAAYQGDVGVEAELPVGLRAYRRQQARWARGSLECAWLHLPSLLRAPVSRPRRLWAALHLTGYSIHLLLLALSALYPLLLTILATDRSAADLVGLLGVMGLPALAPSILFAVGQGLLGRPRRALLLIVPLSLLGVGMMVNTARAALAAACQRSAHFERTPKYGAGARGGTWRRLGYQIRGDWGVAAEAGLAMLNLATCAAALASAHWAIAFFAGLFGTGLAFVAALSIAEAARGVWDRRAAPRAALTAGPVLDDAALGR